MALDGVLQADPTPSRAEEPWWLAAPALQRAIEQQAGAPLDSTSYLVGDVVLEVAADDPLLLATFTELYGDCEIPPGHASQLPRIRCTVRRASQPPLVLLTFDQGAPPDAAAAAISLLRAAPVAPPYTAQDSALPGWRLAGGADRTVVAAHGPHVLVDPSPLLADFLVEYLVSIALTAQPDLLVLHAAAIAVHGAGLLLVGPSHGGKTTTSLHLAARGHTLLADEAGVVRLATPELLPLRRAVTLRPGPRTPALAAVLVGGSQGHPPAAPGAISGRVRIGDLFPGAPPGPVPLRAVFILGGFASHPAVEPFALAPDDAITFDYLSNCDIAHGSWGLTPGRRAVRVVTVRRLLARLPCWRLQVGPPGETAELIERLMEDLSC
jgi:hypothetical protein